MIDRRSRRDRDRIIGLALLAVALVIAIGLVASRLASDEGDSLVAPTALPMATAPPLPPATPQPATPTPLPGSSPAAAADGGPPADGQASVCLDPGHGGADLGNVRVENRQITLQEKDLTLAHALVLGERLRDQGIEVIYTRTTDAEVNPNNEDVNSDGVIATAGGEANSDQLDDLQARVNVCNVAGADLLVSVHYNSAENEFLEGYEVWYNDERSFSDRSRRFASLIHQELGPRMAAAGYPALDHGLGTEDHVVTGPARPGELVPSTMPGAIVEGLFLSNDEDAAFVVTDAATEAIVSAYAQAILDYFAEFPG